jgi:hypothetical protein
LLNGLARPRLMPQWPWYGTAVVTVSGIALIAVLVAVVEHKESHFAGADDCPRAAVVNRALATHVGAPTAVSATDLLGCFYAQGSDQQTVSVSFLVRVHVADPCQKRPPIHVSGVPGCDVSGTKGTSRTGESLLVEANKLQYQFSSNLRQVSLIQLESLAGQALDAPPPLLQNGDGRPH